MSATRARPVEAGAEGSLAFAGAAALAAAIGRGEVTSVGLTALFRGRIARHGGTLGAIVCADEAGSLRAARALDAELEEGRPAGPLHGVPVTVKESFDVAGLATTANFAPLRRNVARSDGAAVRRLREAGAVILGKTNVPPLLADYQTFGPLFACANNPHDLSRTPGGSTGGGAAAVAAGLSPLETGSDLAGSLRVPAHFCGIFGLKPTDNGATLGEGHVPPLPGGRGGFVAMAAVGPLARNMADIAVGWAALSRLDPPAHSGPQRGVRGLRIGWFDGAGPIGCDGATAGALAQLMRLLEREGAVLDRCPFDRKWLDEACAVWGLTFGAMVAQDASWPVRRLVAFAFRRRQRGAAFDLASPVAKGLETNFRRFARALARRRDLAADMKARFDRFDFIVGPVAAGPAFRHDPRRGPIRVDGSAVAYADYAAPFAIPANAAGYPVLVVPAGRSAEGLPIGLQVAAPPEGEAGLIRFGAALEALGLTSPIPPAFSRDGG